MDTTFDRLKSILTAKFNVPDERIQPEASLEDLGLDSLDYIELLFEVEEAFAIRIPQDGGGADAARGANVQTIVDTIDRLVAAKAEPAP